MRTLLGQNLDFNLLKAEFDDKKLQNKRESGRRKNGGAIGLPALRFCPLSFCEKLDF